MPEGRSAEVAGGVAASPALAAEVADAAAEVTDAAVSPALAAADAAAALDAADAAAVPSL